MSTITISHSINVIQSTTDWSISNVIPQFNPDSGTLTKVSVEILVAGETKVEVESKSRLRRTVTAGSTITGNVLLASGPSVSAALSNMTTRSLAGFDGVVDYAGTSGFTHTTTGSASESIDVSDLVPFIGTGTVPVQVSATAQGSYKGPADYSFQVSTQSSAVVYITYEFTPAV